MDLCCIYACLELVHLKAKSLACRKEPDENEGPHADKPGDRQPPASKSRTGSLSSPSANPEAAAQARPVLASAPHVLHGNAQAVAGSRQQPPSSSFAQQQPSSHQHLQQPSDHSHAVPQQHAFQHPSHHNPSQALQLHAINEQGQAIPMLCPHCFDFLASDNRCCPAAAAAHRADRLAALGLHHMLP